MILPAVEASHHYVRESLAVSDVIPLLARYVVPDKFIVNHVGEFYKRNGLKHRD